MAQQLKCRPSEVYGIGGFPGYCLDEAVILWGTSFETALHTAVDGATDRKKAATAQQRVLRRWLPSEGASYRDPGRQ